MKKTSTNKQYRKSKYFSQKTKKLFYPIYIAKM